MEKIIDLFDINKYQIKEDLNDLYIFFEKNQHLFKKTINGESDSNKHKNFLEKVKIIYHIEFPYGKCFPISQFIFYFLGGYNSNYVLKCIKKIPIKLKDEVVFTSHWFVQCKKTLTIYDLTKKQFDKILPIENYYHLGKRSNYGFKWLKKKGKIYKNVVPCSQVLILYQEYRKTIKNETLEFFYNELQIEKNFNY
jgi:hypothetical protein